MHSEFDLKQIILNPARRQFYKNALTKYSIVYICNTEFRVHLLFDRVRLFFRV